MLRGDADDLGVVLSSVWDTAPPLCSLFGSIARVSRFPLNGRKCVFVPLWDYDEKQVRDELQTIAAEWGSFLAMSYGKYLGINLDIGHYVAGTGESPISLIENHHERILSLHLKDRKKNDGPNMPWGEGDTPIAEVLQFIKKNKLKIVH